MDPFWTTLTGGGAAGAVVAVCVLGYKALEVYLKTRKRKKLNGGADHTPPSHDDNARATAEALVRFAEVQRDSLEIVRGMRHEQEEAHRRIEGKLEQLPAQVALHVRAGR